MSQKGLRVSQNKQCPDPVDENLALSMMNIYCHPCIMFEVISHPEEVETIDTNTFEYSERIGDRVKKLVSSKFMDMMRSVSFIFDTKAT